MCQDGSELFLSVLRLDACEFLLTGLRLDGQGDEKLIRVEGR
jgi:hypothetical protein